MNVTIDLVKGTTDLKREETDAMFTFSEQNKMVNEFLSKQAAADKKSSLVGNNTSKKYRPFEDGESKGHEVEDEDPFTKMARLSSFTFSASTAKEA